MQPLLPLDQIRELPLPELAIALLKKLADDRSGAQVDLASLGSGLRMALLEDPPRDESRLYDRLGDAAAWLVSKGLVGPTIAVSGSQFRVTGPGLDVLTNGGIARLWANELLSGPLHPELTPARLNFNLGEYEIAVTAAMKAVEVAVRDLADADDSYGTTLMGIAFSEEKGPLTDLDAEIPVRRGIRNLFHGAISVYRNPTSHRRVTYEPQECAEVVLFANLLLRIVDRSRDRMASRSPDDVGDIASAAS